MLDVFSGTLVQIFCIIRVADGNDVTEVKVDFI